ncbi:peptidylprolyl isomerase [Pseudoduganella sp. HUAS MS19]
MTPSDRHCSNCKRPMRVLDLSGHYQRRVEIDSCPHCCLVWFDDTESVRLAGPGIAELVREIHGAMQPGGEHAHAVSLARVQSCPVCSAALKHVFDMSRFGRTSKLECPQGHGYYQTYILYLAEKGFARPLAWSDIRSLQAAGKEVFCAGCGFPLSGRPVEACPACRSAVGVIDPARLAMAVAPDGAAGAAPAPEVGQHACHACGGAIDLTRDIHCPRCQAPVLRRDTEDAARAATAAAQAAEAALASVRDDIKLKTAAQHVAVNFGEDQRAQGRNGFQFRLALGLLIGAVALAAMAWYRQAAQRSTWTPQEAPLISYSPRFKEADLRCDIHSSVRREVRVRQLVVVPGAPGPGPAKATFGAMQAAYQRARVLRGQWENGGAFEILAEEFNNPYASPRSIPSGFFRRGEASAVVERAAFCLPVHEISPPLLAEDGFHIIEVLEAR